MKDGVVTEPGTYEGTTARLLAFGDCRKLPRWPEELDYLQLGFTTADIPALLRMSTDDDLLWAESESLEVWAPVHAWRTLGQLRAEAAIEPLLDLLDLIDERGDDWVGEDVPEALGLIGPAALPALRAYLLNDAHEVWAEVAAAGAVEKIAERHPAAKPDCVAALVETLERYPDNDPTLNAFVISSLLDLGAVRAAQLMERAFAADDVDLSIMGDWEEAQIRMGWKIARDTPVPAGGWFAAEEERALAKDPGYWGAAEPLPPPSHSSQRKAKAKAKAKRKQADKSRKKNRKR